jgi:hypothetical protein
MCIRQYALRILHSGQAADHQSGSSGSAGSRLRLGENGAQSINCLRRKRSACSRLTDEMIESTRKTQASCVARRRQCSGESGCRGPRVRAFRIAESAERLANDTPDLSVRFVGQALEKSGAGWAGFAGVYSLAERVCGFGTNGRHRVGEERDDVFHEVWPLLPAERTHGLQPNFGAAR